MIFLTGTDQGRARLNESALLLQCLILFALLGGFLAISLAPALYPNRPKLRVTSLLFGSFCGGLGLVAACQLGATKQLVDRLDKVQEEVEISRLAAEQYLQSERASAEAEAALQNPPPPTYTPTYLPQGAYPEPVSSEVSKPISSAQDASPGCDGGSIKSAIAIVAAAQKARAEGLSDSRIIQEILGYRGSQYNKGKELLLQIVGGSADEAP